jgi:hypothetical protein
VNNDATLEPLLQTVIRREGRSLLQYVGESFPWTTPEHQALLGELRQLTAEENEAVAGLARFLRKRRLTPPYLGAYPMNFTSYGFVSLEYMLPLLVENQRRAIAELERDLDRLHDDAARAELRKVLEMKQRHLKQLEGLAAGKPGPATVKH